MPRSPLWFLPQFLWRLFHNQPIGLAFDITSQCNLHCPYCYWWVNRLGQQLSLEQIVSICQKYRRQGILHATWIGGEPTLRADVLKAITPIFPVNWLVTNGLPHRRMSDHELFSLPNTHIIVSLDGLGDKHDQSRGRSGLYAQIEKRFWDKPIMTTTTLHQGNKDQPQKLLQHWSRSQIKAMTFEFTTPVGRRPDPKMDILGNERDEVIEELISLKKRYGRLMANSLKGLQYLRQSDQRPWQGPANCPTAKYIRCLGEQGELKKPCVFGFAASNPHRQEPVCSACGCHVSTMLWGLRHFNWQAIDGVFWFFRH